MAFSPQHSWAAALRRLGWALWPAPVQVDRRERLRALIGAGLGVLVAALGSRLLMAVWPAAWGLSTVWLLAPLGASAVLVFAAPASPLAQPWAVLGGNTLSACTGVLCAQWVPDPVLAAALAVALAIAVMFTLRCLHPPGGAMALSAVLTHAQPMAFPLITVGVNAVWLVMAGLAYNRLTGRPYPHPQQRPAQLAEAVVGARFQPEDLDAALARYNQVLDISRDDLEALLHETALTAHRRRWAGLRCRDVMTREVHTVEFGAGLQTAWALMRTHRIKALPVLDRARRVVGILTQADFLRVAGLDDAPGLAQRLQALIRPDGRVHSDKPAVVGQIMTRQVRVVSADRHVMELMPLFTEAGHHHIPVIDAERRLVGMITQSDFVRALQRLDA